MLYVPKETLDIKIGDVALTGVAQWVGHHPTKQMVAGSIPGQDTCLGCGFGAHMRGNQSLFPFLSFSLHLSLKLNK